MVVAAIHYKAVPMAVIALFFLPLLCWRADKNRDVLFCILVCVCVCACACVRVRARACANFSLDSKG